MARTISRIRRNTGANVLVEAFGEVLLLPGGDVDKWNRKFINTIKRTTAAAAPANKRPPWAHYGGKTLKKSFRGGKPEFFKTNGGGRIYAAVGSTSAHAWYVDQGTGIYGGSGPYLARILPPWREGGASLYEATWRPGIDPNEPGPRKVAPVWIKGQKPQYFFATGMEKAFLAMRLQRSVAAPYQIASAMKNPMIEGSLGFFGNTENTPAFQGQLEEWRMWRDQAWGEFRALGRAAGLNRRLQGRDKSRVRDNQMLSRVARLEAARLRRREEENRRVREGIRRESLSEQRKREKEATEAESYITIHLRGEARSLAKRYANLPGYTNVSTFSIRDSAGNVYGYGITFTDPSGKTQRIELK